MRVLVAEDERRVARAIERGLRREGLAVDLAHDGRSAVLKARANGYDVLVLDRHLPELHGDEVCRLVADELPSMRVLGARGAGASPGQARSAGARTHARVG